jgi:hypothetical protein
MPLSILIGHAHTYIFLSFFIFHKLFIIFDRFLEYISNNMDFVALQGLCFNELEEVHITTDLIGKFGNYLFKFCPRLKKYNSANMYFSSIYNQIVRKFPQREQFLKANYTTARKSMYDDFEAKARAAGVPLQKNSSKGTESDYIYISKKLFEEGTNSSLYSRGIIVFDFQGVGRISEVLIMFNFIHMFDLIHMFDIIHLFTKRV